jgi:hypothetical protein
MDFMSDALVYFRKIWILHVLDDFYKEAIANEADNSLPGDSTS